MGDLKKLFKEKSLCLSLGKHKEAAEICNAIGNEYVNQERYEDALEQHIEELEYCTLTGDELSIAIANRKIGESYAFLFKFQKAIEHIQKYYDIAVSVNSVVEQQRAHSTFGRTFYLKHQNEIACGVIDPKYQTLDRALLEYLKAFKLLHKLALDMKPDELAEMKCRLLLNMGLVFECRKDYEASCEKINEGLEIAMKNHLHEDIQRCGLAIGTIHLKTNKLPEANRFLDIALSAAKKMNNKNMMCEILLYKGLVLISMESFACAKKYLKSAFKLHSSNSEDHSKISKALKVCIGIYNAKCKLESCQKISEKKQLLEKIADGLSSIYCYKLAIKYYQSTVDCINEANMPKSEKAPIYFSLAKSYLDDDNVSKALEYFEKEYSCNEDKPDEQVSTLLEIADALERAHRTEKIEEVLLKAVTIAERTKNATVLHNALSKLLSLYEKVNKSDDVKAIQARLNNVEPHSDGVESEDSPDIFTEVNLSELSDSDCDDIGLPASRRKRTKNVERKVNAKGETPLHQACISNNLSEVKKLVESGHSVNVRDNCGWTPLHEACNFGFYEVVKYLIDKGAKINDPGGPECGGITALHDAASCGHFEIMSLLISKGASVTAKDQNGETPLHALLQWRQRAGDLDEVTLRQCQGVESELREKMREKGVNVDDIVISSNNAANGHGDAELPCGEKRTRSPSLSPPIVSDGDEDMDSDVQCFHQNEDSTNWEEANSAKAEYKSVMESLRRSAAVITPGRTISPDTPAGPPLLNEKDIVTDWLIKDTNSVKKAKRKKRRLNKLIVRTSKRIEDFLIKEDPTSSSGADFQPSNFEEDSNFSLSSVDSAGTDNESVSSNASKDDSSVIFFNLRIEIDEKLILVPVPDVSMSVSWLAEEAAQRYKNLDGRMPHLTLTKHGALLSGTDLIKNIFLNNEKVSAIVDSWEELSVDEQYVRICAKQKILPFAAVKKLLKSSELSSELDLSKCYVPFPHSVLIFCSLSSVSNLVHLNVSGVVINDSEMKAFLDCVPIWSSLQVLNMSGCAITSECLEMLTDFIKSKTAQSVFHELKTLDLSYNYFLSDTCLSPLLSLSSLTSLNLITCGLTSSLFDDPEFCKALQCKNNLEDLNISGNCLGEAGISNLFHFLPTLGLRKLDLSHTADESLNLGSKMFCLFTDVLPSLTDLILQGCCLIDVDIRQICLCLARCPQLQVCDLSGNSSLSQSVMIRFISEACENCPNLARLNVTGTCVWDDENFPSLERLLNLPHFKHICIDGCSDNFSEKLIELWEKKWDNKGLHFLCGFLDLSLA